MTLRLPPSLLAFRDHPLLHLFRWEWRSARRGAWVGASLAVALGLAMTYAVLSEPYVSTTGESEFLQQAAMLFCFTPPFHDSRLLIAQGAPGYALLRWCSWIAIACARLFLPALASRSIGSDRQSGRLLELQLTPLPAWQLFLTRVVAYALPYLLAYAWLALIALPLLRDEPGTGPGFLRISLETLGQILLTSAVALAATARRGTRWSGLLLTCGALWMLIPFLWFWLLPQNEVGAEQTVRSGMAAFPLACLRQSLLTLLILTWALVSGSRTLDLTRSELGLRASLQKDGAP